MLTDAICSLGYSRYATQSGATKQGPEVGFSTLISGSSQIVTTIFMLLLNHLDSF